VVVLGGEAPLLLQHLLLLLKLLLLLLLMLLVLMLLLLMLMDGVKECLGRGLGQLGVRSAVARPDR